MAILEQVNVPAPVAAVTTNNRRPFPAGVAFDRPRAKVWGNWGYVVNGNFVPLPLGTPIDTMEPASVTGQNAEAVKRNAAKNELLSALQAIGASMKPGEEKELTNLVFRLRRVNEDLEIVKSENEFSVGDLVGLLTKEETKELHDEMSEKASELAKMQAQIETLTKALAAKK